MRQIEKVLGYDPSEPPKGAACDICGRGDTRDHELELDDTAKPPAFDDRDLFDLDLEPLILVRVAGVWRHGPHGEGCPE